MLHMSIMKPYDNTTATLPWHGALISIKENCASKPGAGALVPCMYCWSEDVPCLQSNTAQTENSSHKGTMSYLEAAEYFRFVSY